MSNRIDHAKAAGAFISKTEHVAFHDKRLWDLREKRDAQAHGIAEWETMRELASGIKEHTLSHLSAYLEQFADAAAANGVVVHWAANAEEHNEIVYRLMSERGMTALVKSKSMLTDECAMRDYLEPRGIAVMETDLGERIQQLDHQDPSHMVVPAVHKLRGDVAELFGRTIGLVARRDSRAVPRPPPPRLAGHAALAYGPRRFTPATHRTINALLSSRQAHIQDRARLRRRDHARLRLCRN